MKVGLLLSSILSFSFSCSCYAQEYSYAHYDIADGLASSTVYCITQDKDGFIWLGTEAGVCRFDGTRFQTFTTADGLSDAEVLKIFGDSKGRVWMAPFGGTVCYFYQGRIHNRQNDSLLSKMGPRENIQNFAEDAQGNILIQQMTSLTVVGMDGHVKCFDSAGGVPITGSVGCSRSADGHFNVQIDQRLFKLSDIGLSLLNSISFPKINPNYIVLSPSWGVWKTEPFAYTSTSLINGRRANYACDNSYYTNVSSSIIDDSLLCFNELFGVEVYSLARSVLVRKFLPGKKVSRTFSDRAGNVWFTTIGNGIYRLKSTEFRTVTLPENGMGMTSVTSITLNQKGDDLLVGDNHDGIFALRLPDLQLSRSTPRRAFGDSRILFVHEFKKNWFISGSDANLNIGVIGRKPDNWTDNGIAVGDGIKSACMLDENRILLGGPWGVGIFDLRKKAIVKTIWKDRITAVYGRNDTNYIGTLHGLWRIAGKAPPVYLGGQIPFLRNRIAAMQESADGTLWIASYDNTIIALSNGRIVATITKKNGLNGNVCHCLLLNGHGLWIGTDKGLNKIALDLPGYPVVTYTSRNGLASDVVNAVYVLGSTVFVGNPEGLTYFDEKKVNPGDECRLVLTSAISSGHNRTGDTGRMLLPAGENNIRFQFSAISYRSQGNITYLHRLIGLDSTWQETKENFLEYPTLPYGKYDFQLQAFNRFGIRSQLLSLPFVVDTPFWQTLWGYAIIIATFLLLVWLLVDWRIRRIRRRQKEKERLNQRLVELETTALQSQMNPHFIFNCLNSIQQYILDHEALIANRYLADFARLIRATLNNSSKTFIPLTDEVDYLSTYLSLEQLRFQDKMEYVIDIDPSIDKEGFIIPPMLIQPFVENSMRHGLRHKKDGKGIIRVLFTGVRDRLQVVVEDNGIGRKKAGGYKTREHIEYQSKGMSLTADRIRMIDAKYHESIHVEVVDLEDGSGHPSGTRVILRFPLFHQILQNDIS